MPKKISNENEKRPNHPELEERQGFHFGDSAVKPTEGKGRSSEPHSILRNTKVTTKSRLTDPDVDNSAYEDD